MRGILRLLAFLPPSGSDADTVYVDIQCSGTEQFAGTSFDAATVYVDIQASAVENLQGVEAATVYVDIQPSGTDILSHAAATDSATIYLDIKNTGGECYTTFTADYFGEGDDFLQWYTATDPVLQWLGDVNLQWGASVSIGEAIHC